MSSIHSRITSISELRFEPFPAKPIDVVKVCTSDNAVVALARDGRIYTNKVKKHCAYLGSDAGLESVLRGAIKLGALTREAVDEHIRHKTAEADARRAHYDASSIARAAERLQLKLTKQQLARLERCRLADRAFDTD